MNATAAGVDSNACDIERLIEDLAFLVVRQHRHNQAMKSPKRSTSEKARDDHPKLRPMSGKK